MLIGGGEWSTTGLPSMPISGTAHRRGQLPSEVGRAEHDLDRRRNPAISNARRGRRRRADRQRRSLADAGVTLLTVGCDGYDTT